MKTSSTRSIHFWLWSSLLFLLTPFSPSHAATVAIDSLLIDYASLTISITGAGSNTYSGPVVPPVGITMGEYQDPIVQLNSGSYNARIYSTGTLGNPAPSGSVDTVSGTINVDFSSLRAAITTLLYGSLDIALWPITTPPSDGTYDSATGAYSLTWSNPFGVLVGRRTISGTVDVTLSGTATLVPVPAALWLLGSGLLGLASLARRRKVFA